MMEADQFSVIYSGHEALFPIGTTLKEVRTAFSKSGGFVKKKELSSQHCYTLENAKIASKGTYELLGVEKTDEYVPILLEIKQKIESLEKRIIEQRDVSSEDYKFFAFALRWPSFSTLFSNHFELFYETFFFRFWDCVIVVVLGWLCARHRLFKKYLSWLITSE